MIAALRDLVARHATAPGRHEAALPGLIFTRADRPTPMRGTLCPSLVLAVIVQGAKQLHIGGGTLRYDADTYLVITGEVEYESAVVDASPSRPYLSVALQLPPELIVRTLLSFEPAPASAAAEPAAAYVSRIDAPLVDAVLRLLRTLDDPDERRVVAPLAIAEIAFRLLRSDWAATLRRAAHRDDDQTRIAQAMTFMQANLDQRLSVASCARHVAMSPSHFAHRFRDVARMSPIAYLKHLRLHEARVLLLQEGLRPAEAAARVGYGSAAHFNRDFKERFELPPAAYARRFRESQESATGSQSPASP